MRPGAHTLLACRFLEEEVRRAAGLLRADVEVRPAPCPARCAAAGAGEPAGAAPTPWGPADPPRLVAACADARRGRAWPPAPTTFHLLADEAVLDPLLAAGALLTTPGWLRGWRERLAEGGPLEHALELLREAHRSVVLLDTGVDAGAPTEAARFAEALGLPLARVPVGLAHLGREVALVLEAAGRRDAEHRAADAAAVLDTLYALPPSLGEVDVLERFADLVDVLYAPERLVVRVAGGPLDGVTLRRGAGDLAALEAALEEASGEVCPTPGGQGLLLRVGPEAAPVALVALDGVAFPAHLPRYARLAPALGSACFLAVSRARELAKLARSEAELRAHRDHLEALVAEALRKVDTLHGLLPICAHCKKIRDDAGYWTRIETYISDHSSAEFTHGLCPDCFQKYYPE